MRNVSRNKFLLCFRPVVDMDMDLMLESKAVMVDRSQNHQEFMRVGVKDKEDMRPSTTNNKSSVSDTENSNSITIHRPGKKPFSQVIKAVVLEILMAKRVRDHRQGSYSSKHNFPLSSCDKLLDLDTIVGKPVNKDMDGKGIQDTISKSNPISPLSSSSSSSIQKQKRQDQQNNCNNTCRNRDKKREMKPKQEGIGRGSCSNSAIFMLLITLAVTIFWGKFFAILFTSIWLCFLPHKQSTRVIGNQENITTLSPEKKSRDYRKKIIMEGLLERNCNRGALNLVSV